MSHPLRELAHDHRDLNELLIAVHEAMQRISRGVSRAADELHEIRDGVEAFRDALLEHFAREQEALLPFVVGRLPAFEPRTRVIVDEHDRLAAALTALARDIARIDENTRPDEVARALDGWRDTLETFETLYAAHARTELGFLEEVDRALAGDANATEQLRELLEAS